MVWNPRKKTPVNLDGNIIDSSNVHFSSANDIFQIRELRSNLAIIIEV
jgi:hypothetical protein